MGGCFIALAAYIAYESASTLIGHEFPERSIPGIIVAAVSVVLCRCWREANAGLLPGSGAGPCKPILGRPISARKTDFCTYHGRDGGAQLSAELLGVFATVELLPSELRSVGRMQNARYHFNELRRHKRLLNEGPPVIQHK